MSSDLVRSDVEILAWSTSCLESLIYFILVVYSVVVLFFLIRLCYREHLNSATFLNTLFLLALYINSSTAINFPDREGFLHKGMVIGCSQSVR